MRRFESLVLDTATNTLQERAFELYIWMCEERPVIGNDPSSWTNPTLFVYFERDFDEKFLGRLHELLDNWDDVHQVNDLTAVTEEMADHGTAKLARGFDGMEFSLRVKQSRWDSMDLAPLIVRNAYPRELDGPRWFDFVIGLYNRCVEAGRRPLYTIVTRRTGELLHLPFSEQSIRSGNLYELDWIHVLTPTQVEAIGRNRVLTAPATRVEELGGGSIALGLTLGDDDEEAQVSEHLGIEIPAGSDWFDDLTHDVDYVRHRAARTIKSKLGRDEVRERELLDYLDVEDPKVRFILTKAISPTEEGVFEPVLRRLALSDESEAVRSIAVKRHRSDDVACEALWDDSPRVQSSAISKLFRCPDEDALRRVVELLDSENFQARETAADRILSDQFVKCVPDGAVESARQALANHSDHSDSRVRRRALEAAERLELSDYEARVATALRDESPKVRIAAAERYPDVMSDVTPAVDCLMELIEENENYANPATKTVLDVAPRRAFRELVSRIGDSRSNVKKSAARHLERVIEDRGDSWTRDALKAVEPAARDAALSELEDAERGERLQGLLAQM